MQNLKELRDRYERELLDNILPFWLSHGLDRINGGIYTGLGRDGALIESDKSVWFQGRALWVFSKAYERYKRPEYLEAADLIAAFLISHCFDDDGRMFFRVSADGRPVIKRLRYFFSEAFAAIGFASYAKVSGKDEYKERAAALISFIDKLRTTPGILIPKFNPDVEPMRALSEPMILINVLSEVYDAFPDLDPFIPFRIDSLIAEVDKYFVKDDLSAVLESVAPDGSFIRDHFEGRILNPGHAIEASWFIMDEGIKRDRQDYISLGLKILDWEWDIGWDAEYGGGIIQYRDVLGLPLSEYHQDMKFWWPQCEAMISNLLAYSLTHDDKYLKRAELVDDYISDHFVDRMYGEWFGYLHRDGSLATEIKGNMYKGPFHIPRMYMKAIEIIDSIE